MTFVSGHMSSFQPVAVVITVSWKHLRNFWSPNYCCVS